MAFARIAFVFVAVASGSIDRFGIEVWERGAFETGGLVARRFGDDAIGVAENGFIAVAELRKRLGIARRTDFDRWGLNRFDAGGILATVGAFLGRIFARCGVALGEFVVGRANIAVAWSDIGFEAGVVSATIGTSFVDVIARFGIASFERESVFIALIVLAWGHWPACAVLAAVGACFVGILPRIAITFFERFIV